MAKISEVTLNGMQFEIYSVTGEVMDSKKWTSTHVSGGGGGGGGFLYGGTGQVSTQPVSIQSTTLTHDQLFIRGPEGKEICVETTGVNLQVRPGNFVSAVWMIKKGKERGPYWAIHNHHTDRTEWLDVSSLLRPWFFGKGRVWLVMAVLMGLAGFAGLTNGRQHDDLTAFMYFLAGIVLGGWTLWIYLRVRGREKQLKRHFAAMVLPILLQNEKAGVSPTTS